MFDITNEELIMKLIEQKDDNFVIPLYVKIDNDMYSILELDEITRFNLSSFKVGFGSLSGLFVKQQFDQKYIHDFNVVKLFKKFDDELGTDIRYVVFESGQVPSLSNLHMEVNGYVSLLSEYVSEHVAEVRRELIRKQMEENS